MKRMFFILMLGLFVQDSFAQQSTFKIAGKCEPTSITIRLFGNWVDTGDFVHTLTLDSVKANVKGQVGFKYTEKCRTLPGYKYVRIGYWYALTNYKQYDSTGFIMQEAHDSNECVFAIIFNETSRVVGRGTISPTDCSFIQQDKYLRLGYSDGSSVIYKRK